MTHSAKLLVGLGVGTLIGVGACWDDGPTVPDLPSPTIVLSDTSVFATGAALAGDMASSSLASEPEVAYVSLPPGSIPDGVSAVITNRRTQTSATTVMLDGGFDPVSIAARPDDTLETVVSRGNSESVILLAIVPRNRPPKLVRTIPPRGKKDVPLNARITIVFSEPIDPASVSQASIRLVRGAVGVPGTIETPDTEGLTVDFVPDEALAPGSTHQLVLSGEIRDRDGDALEDPSVVEFTTEGTAAVVGLIAYFGSNGIYVAESDGRFPTRIHSIDDVQRHRGLGLSWSPDGSRIAFAAPRFRQLNTPGAGIFIANADGSGTVLLTIPPGWADDIQPAWSPDGSRIAFVRWGGNGNDSDPSHVLHVVKVDGSGLITLSSDGERPAWSPDGSRVAFSKGDGIFLINADGSGLRRLTSYGDEPAWSPDGTKIAFTGWLDDNFDIYLTNVDGSGVNRLTTAPFDDMGPNWSPDGTRIVFTRESSGWHDIYMMNADGSNTVQLTNTSAMQELWPAFSPTLATRSTSLALEAAPGSYTGRQIDSVFATLTHPFEVRVLRNGQPAAGVTVSWTVWGGSISSAQTTTDAAGRTSVVATLAGPEPKWLYAEASVAGAIGSPVWFQAASTPGRSARIRFDRMWRYDPDRNQLTDDGRALVLLGDTTLQYSVETTDVHGNIITGVRVDFAVASGGGSVSPAVDTTEYWQDEDGYCGPWCVSAYTNHRLGPNPGQQSVTATASELAGAPQLTFSAIPVSVIVTFGDGDEPQFTPGNPTVSVGATVGWRLWWGNQEHNVAFEDDPKQPVSSGIGRLHTRTFSAPGIYRYRCTLHSGSFADGESGTVTVR